MGGVLEVVPYLSNFRVVVCVREGRSEGVRGRGREREKEKEREGEGEGERGREREGEGADSSRTFPLPHLHMGQSFIPNCIGMHVSRLLVVPGGADVE